MEIKKLKLNVDEKRLGKKILTDIIGELKSADEFIFRFKPKGHTDHKEHDNHSDNYTYCDIGRNDHLDFPASHTDHVDYSEAYTEKAHSEYKEYREAPKRHVDYRP